MIFGLLVICNHHTNKIELFSKELPFEESIFDVGEVLQVDLIIFECEGLSWSTLIYLSKFLETPLMLAKNYKGMYWLVALLSIISCKFQYHNNNFLL